MQEVLLPRYHSCLNDYLLAILLGIIEGLTEFLPVSSTAHLRISEAILGVDLSDGFWKLFSIVIQIGAILCLPIYFWSRIKAFLASFPNGSRGDRTVVTHPVTLTLIGFFCTAIPAFLLTKVIGKNLESLRIMGFALIIGGIVMWAVDAVYGNKIAPSMAQGADELEHMSLGQAIWIGLCQALAPIFPGTSRSMCTIAAGQIAGLTRTAALEFSFFLSIPTMAAAVGYDLLKSLRPSHSEGAAALGAVHVTGHQWAILILGTVVSFIVALAVVAWFMNWVRKRGFTPFAVYRVLAGIAVLYWLA